MNWIGLSALVHREVSRILKVINQAIFPPVVSSLLFLAIFHFILGREGAVRGFSYLEFLVPGLIMMSVVNNAYQNSAFSVFIAKYGRHWEHLLTMPLSYFELAVGVIVGSALRSFLTAVCIIIATAFFIPLHFANIFVLILFFSIATVTFGAFGILVALWAEQFDQLGMITTFALTPLTMLGGVFYSIALLPDQYRWLTMLNPIFYLVDGFRYGMLGISDAPIWIGLLVTGTIAIILFALVVGLMSRGWRVKE